MFSAEIFQLSYQALLLILILSGPPILISMALGLFVAIFQAATQIQEQTLSFTVKLIAVILTLFILGGWLGAQIMQFTNTILVNFPKWSY
ncbi:MAG: EscS/YscS/HrcS family type III secretion system export apparatus protein [Chlamydiae bacterium GWC2_50_10]|nr:MAG: EscS/YscS/HrcS family type III secretion system export apparatus protein [Chlamydiae bacterium GWA2_50_15]OGN54740.1 MAG: EscS/YscS/HrcS family type III secretion system export apparatus protein [Chlamydiae bacterium GWC2_50_10]OGN57492.1 MAG: EscS/YscS/HrcS family type III secretion system export apparatus protein [Chlamydiae bacterium RIFCSPHIGHO2_02_FULL_49_29]OGN71099.1 MAG: EscS/YscS/HrcS family type III secretion system export apparatus protein [Chlamydiae bacterium RIFCSPLOWO2_02_